MRQNKGDSSRMVVAPREQVKRRRRRNGNYPPEATPLRTRSTFAAATKADGKPYYIREQRGAMTYGVYAPVSAVP